MKFCTLPNLLSISRVLLAGIVIWGLVRDYVAVSLCAYVCALLSDLLDGRLARARGDVQRYGTLIDHGCDAFFVTTIAASGARLGLVPPLLPVCMALAFVQYALDAKSPAAGLRASRLGRLNGVAYFVFAGMLIGVRHLWPTGAPWLWVCGIALLASTIVSMVMRGAFVARQVR